MDADFIVIGGGPAGLAAAARLARNRLRVRLFEQRTLPQTKCCGEFLHPVAMVELRRLLGREFNAAKIGQVQIVSEKFSKTFPIEAGAGAMERIELSKILLEQAVQAGVQIEDRLSARVESDGEKIRVRVGGRSIHAKAVLIAHGTTPASQKSGQIFYGFSVKFPGTGVLESVAIASLNGGYAGLCNLGRGTITLAGLLSERTYRRLTPNRPRFGERLLIEIPAWKAVIPEDAQANLFQVPATSGGPLARASTDARIFYAGDAAGIHETAFGDGIARALRQARMIEETWINHNGDFTAAGREYRERLRQDDLRPGRILLKAAGFLLRSPFWSGMILRHAEGIVSMMVRRATSTGAKSDQNPANPRNHPAARLPATT